MGKVASQIMALSLSTALLAGCGSAVKQTFDLSPATSGNMAAGVKAPKRSNAQLLVANPSALKALDSQNIVVRGGDGSIAYLGKAQWSDRLTDMVQMRLVQALQDSHHFAGVGRPVDSLNADYQLMTNLRVFGVDVTKAGNVATVEIAANIVDNKLGAIRKTRVFTAQKQVAGKSNADYALALDNAFAIVLQEIVHWTAQSL